MKKQLNWIVKVIKMTDIRWGILLLICVLPDLTMVSKFGWTRPTFCTYSSILTKKSKDMKCLKISYNYCNKKTEIKIFIGLNWKMKKLSLLFFSFISFHFSLVEWIRILKCLWKELDHFPILINSDKKFIIILTWKIPEFMK